MSLFTVVFEHRRDATEGLLEESLGTPDSFPEKKKKAHSCPSSRNGETYGDP